MRTSPARAGGLTGSGRRRASVSRSSALGPPTRDSGRRELSATISSTRSRPSGRCVISRTERSPAAARTSPHELLGGLGVEVRGRLVEHEHRSVGRGAPARAVSRWRWPPESSRALLADERVQPVRERRDPVADACAAERVLELGVGRARAREAEVLADRRVEDVRLLAGERERPADVVLAVARARRGRRSSTRPSSGSRKRSRRFVTVVLPAPLGPTSAIRRPGSSRRSKPLERRPARPGA